MSRTMKADEAVMALAFLSNPEELTMVTPDSSLQLEEYIQDDDFGGGFRGKVTRGLTKILSEKMLDLYSTGEKGSSCNNYCNNNCPNNNPNLEASSKNSSTFASEKAGVCFGTVEVRKYPITIGANPSVSRGVPRTIEWDHLEEETERHHIDAYEREHTERKRGEELLLDGITRAKMLRDLGYTKTELLEGVRRAKEHKEIPRQQRRVYDPVSVRMGSKR